MKNKTIIYILTTIVALLSVSCEKTIEFNGEQTSPVLVMNSIVEKDSTITVNISKSRFFLDNENEVKNIDNAVVKMWINDVEQTPLTFTENGNYISSYKPKTGDKITFTASVTPFKNISSTITIPEMPQVISIDTVSGVINNDGYIMNALYFDLKFKNTIDEDEYFMIYCIERTDYSYQDYDGNTISKIYESSLPISSNDVLVNDADALKKIENNSSVNFQDYYILSDNIIDGKEHTLRFFTQNGNSYYENEKSYIIYFKKISKSWYLYLKSLALLDNGMSFFAEPVQVYTNITNGLGILGSTNAYTKEFTLEYKEIMYGN